MDVVSLRGRSLYPHSILPLVGLVAAIFVKNFIFFGLRAELFGGARGVGSTDRLTGAESAWSPERKEHRLWTSLSLCSLTCKVEVVGYDWYLRNTVSRNA